MKNPFQNYRQIRRWKHENITCYMYDLGYDHIAGKFNLAYRFYWNKKLVFMGRDFFASPLHSTDSLQTLYALLGFLTLRPGDTDAEYFQDYTPIQRDWCNSTDCESLQCWLYDKEN